MYRGRVRPVAISVGWLTALFTILILVSPNIWFLGAIIAGQYLLSAIYDAVIFGYQLSQIPDEFQCRVNSAMRLITFSTQSLGVAATGLLIQRFGIAPIIVLFSALLLSVTLSATLNTRLRQAGFVSSGGDEV